MKKSMRKSNFHSKIILLLSALFVLGGCSFLSAEKPGKKKRQNAVSAGSDENTDMETITENRTKSSRVIDKRPPAVPGATIDPVAGNTLVKDLPKAAYGLRSGRQIYHNYLAVTGLQRNQQLDNAYNSLASAMDGPSDLMSFDAGRQSAIIKLATFVCNALVDNATLRADFFPGVDFNQGISTLNDTAKMSIVTSLTDRFWGVHNLGMDREKVKKDILALINDLAGGIQNPNVPASTINIVKGTCASVAGSFQAIVI